MVPSKSPPMPNSTSWRASARTSPRSLLLLGVLAASCQQTAPPNGDAPTDTPPERVLRPRSQPLEYVGVSVTRTVDEARFLSLVGPIFGAAARAGELHQALELQPGLFLTTEADPRTDDQRIVRLELLPAGDAGSRRTVVRVPVSLAYGEIFIEAVRAALARADEVRGGGAAMAPFELEYRVRSANGGHLDLRLAFQDAAARLTLSGEGPRTALTPGQVNAPAYEGDPYETIAGTVWFSLARAEFDFFATRAYGITAGFRQNFKDFMLSPHDWLRLTVTPRLTEQLIDVGFEVVTVDGRRIPIARAPASLKAGEQFQKNVLRLVENMEAQEARMPGSSDDWVAPFHYDDPDGGGVVKVIARGDRGQFRIAYAVESPTRYLKDVDFVPYAGEVEVPTDIPDEVAPCEALGSVSAPTGSFRLRFKASSTVLEDRSRKAPLTGNVYGSIYRAADVTIRGPNPGARAVASFAFERVDVRDPSRLATYEVPEVLPAGEYQVLGFMDIDGTADPADPGPDEGDPVMIPIGAYPLSCAVQPVDVEFAILLPAGF
jgi:hypothetical protein